MCCCGSVPARLGGEAVDGALDDGPCRRQEQRLLAVEATVERRLRHVSPLAEVCDAHLAEAVLGEGVDGGVDQLRGGVPVGNELIEVEADVRKDFGQHLADLLERAAPLAERPDHS